MQRTFALMLVLALFLFLATTAMLFIGRGQPTSPPIALLHLTDCELPCWIGITPGELSLIEARQRVFDLFGSTYRIDAMRQDPGVNIHDEGHLILTLTRKDNARSIWTIEVDSVYGTVRQVSFDMRSMIGGPSFGEITSLVGIPTCIVPRSKIMLVRGMDTAGDLSIELPANGRFRGWASPVLGIGLYGSGTLPDYCGGTLGAKSPWQGLPSIERYAAER